MNREAMWAIANKDIRAIRTNIQLWLPMVIVPLVLGLILPTVGVLVVKNLDVSGMSDAEELVNMITSLPVGDLKSHVEGLPTLNHRLVYMLVNYMTAPFFMLIAVMASMIIATNSFVGEKERRTLESLLFAPIDTMSLFLGKVLAAFIPAMVLTLGTVSVYGVVVDALTYSWFGGLVFPTFNWLPLVLWVTPTISLCTILISVLISARVKGFQEAQQLAGVIVLPVVALVIGQATGLMLLQTSVMLIIGAVLLVISLGLLKPIAKLNDRNVLFERQVH
ncbi:MAG TPA: ABC transporter permease subunit [Bacilli bacterium]|nr:ABC transporter permease subunit [Bacilli bacterium]